MQEELQMAGFPALLQDKAISRERRNVPHLSERMLVDLVNGITVSQDQIKFKANQGRLSRLWGALDGSNRRRDLVIEENQQAAIEGLLTWVQELTEQERLSKQALTHTHNRIKETRRDLQSVAKVVLAHERQIDALEKNIRGLENRLCGVESRLRRVEAKDAIEETVSQWRASEIHKGYGLPVRAAFLVDDLLTGPFGPVIIDDADLERYLANELTGSLVAVMPNSAPDRPLPMAQWLVDVRPKDSAQCAVQEYLLQGDEVQAPLHSAFGRVVSSSSDADWLDCAERDGSVPALCSPKRMVKNLIHEAKEEIWN